MTLNEIISKTPWLKNFVKPYNTHNPDFYKKTKNGHVFELKGSRTFNYEAGINDLNQAITEAEDLEFPSRFKLYSIYNNLKDLHVKSQIRTAIFKVVSEPWIIVDKNNKEQPNLTELLKKKWFNDLNEHILSTEFWGHSLIYFNLNDRGEFDECKLFPRMHVLPEKKSIIPNLGDPDRMFSYKDIQVLKELFIEVTNTEPLGLLKDITRYSILKNYAIQDWARSSEKWGDPLVVLRSSSTSTDEDDKKEQFLMNFGNNGYAIVNKEDEIELLERSANGTAHKVFLELIKFNNDETSKGINGQTATTEQKSFVGAAQVQERILNDYTLARLKDLMYFHNETTLPFITNYNSNNTVYSKLKGMRWMPVSLLKRELSKLDNNTPPIPLDKNNLNNLSNPFI